MTFARTNTGSFRVGFRQSGSEWQHDPAALCQWAMEERFACLDFGKDSAATGLAAAHASGLSVGTVDLLGREDYEVLIAPDSPTRQEVIAVTTERIAQRARQGAETFFAVTLPADVAWGRRQNFEHLVEAFSALVPMLEHTGTRVALEGWPGLGAVCCTPETFRAFFAAMDSDRFGINYDPSHLLRMGIDPLRFVEEFARRVFHVHAKDAVISADDLYEYGHEQPPTFKSPARWSGATWRYTIPGRGGTPWRQILRVLYDTGYTGAISVEMEDAEYSGTSSDEQLGLRLARDFLEAC